MGYLIVWHDHRNGCCDLYGGRVTTGGIALDLGGFLISDAPNHQKWPALAFDGTNYLVAWQDRRLTLRSDIYGARVSPAGTILDPAAFLIGVAQDEQTLPAVAFSGGLSFVAWRDSRSRTNYDIYGSCEHRGSHALHAQSADLDLPEGRSPSGSGPGSSGPGRGRP
jgi:hypothetical protein